MYGNKASAQDGIIKGWPILGSLPEYRKDRLGFLSQALSKGGDTVRFRLGRHLVTLISHPDDVAQVLQKNAANYLKATNLGEVLGQGVLTAEGELWKRQRRAIQPLFHVQKIHSQLEKMSNVMERHFERLEVAGSPVEMTSFFMRTAYEVIGEALFGSELDPTDFDELHGLVSQLNQGLTRRLFRIVKWPWALPGTPDYQFKTTLQCLDQWIFRVVDTKSPTTDLLSLLLKFKDEETGEPMSRQQIRDEVVTLLLSGHETTALTLSWTLYLLGANPKWVERIRQEAPASRITTQDLEQMPTLDAVLRESMRLYPAVWSFTRRAQQGDRLRKLTLEPSSIVLVSPYFTHRHPEFWSEPESFRPERFLGGEEELSHRFSYLPFGQGPRQCVGRLFAIQEMKTALASFIRDFDFSLIENCRPVPNPQVTLSPGGGVWVRLKKRSR